MNSLIDEFKLVYANLNKNNIDSIAQVYEPHVVFVDPFHEIHGLDKLKSYFTNMYQNIETCEFGIEDVFSNGKSASLYWTMKISHRKLNSGKPVTVPGNTLIRFQDKVTFHQDYFDAGDLIYENIPLLGSIIKRIKHSL